jgi:hypothetical protein
LDARPHVTLVPASAPIEPWGSARVAAKCERVGHCAYGHVGSVPR